MNLYKKPDGDLFWTDGFISVWGAPLWSGVPTEAQKRYAVGVDKKGALILDTARQTADKEAEKQMQNAKIISELEMIDVKSMRSAREYIASKADCPSFLQQHEEEAQNIRKQLQK